MTGRTPDRPPTLLAGQLGHLIGLIVLLVLSGAAWRFVGQPSPALFAVAVAIPVIHQVFVWIVWRLQLHAKPGREILPFSIYKALFFVLFGGRFVSLLALAWADRGSLGLTLVPQVIVTILFLIPGLYAMYSVMRYFGVERAAGIDHFDPRYREMPPVTRGIFRFTTNGMYLYAFMLFWAIPVGFNSSAALVIAAFSDAYIWVHYYATEKPDMDYLYGDRETPPRS